MFSLSIIYELKVKVFEVKVYEYIIFKTVIY